VSGVPANVRARRRRILELDAPRHRSSERGPASLASISIRTGHCDPGDRDHGERRRDYDPSNDRPDADQDRRDDPRNDDAAESQEQTGGERNDGSEDQRQRTP
jgi:hypothetical protein